MEPLGRIYLTHPSFITTIAAAFTILSGAFLFSLKKKSRATANLAAAFLSISFTSVARDSCFWATTASIFWSKSIPRHLPSRSRPK